MNLSRDSRQELRDMGWAVVQSKAQRPPAIQSRDILHVGEDLLLDDRDADEALVALDGQV